MLCWDLGAINVIATKNTEEAVEQILRAREIMLSFYKVWFVDNKAIITAKSSRQDVPYDKIHCGTTLYVRVNYKRT